MHPWLHFKTITKHKLLVMKYCFRIGLYKQGLLHDLSKYTPAEFLVGCKYYQGTRSPNNAEREDIGVSTSWLHHKGRNKHHFEHWVDYSLDKNHVIIVAHYCLIIDRQPKLCTFFGKICTVGIYNVSKKYFCSHRNQLCYHLIRLLFCCRLFLHGQNAAVLPDVSHK